MHKKELDPHKVFVIPNFLSEDECGALIRRSEAHIYEPGTVAGFVNENMRNNERVILDDESLAADLFQRAQPFLPAVLEERSPVAFNERWRFYRYQSGQTFQPHRDGPFLRMKTREQSELTFMIYLNEGMGGGETRFFHDVAQAFQQPPLPYLSVHPQTGMALVFLHALWHEGAVVEHGLKYVLRTDVLYGTLPSASCQP